MASIFVSDKGNTHICKGNIYQKSLSPLSIEVLTTQPWGFIRSFLYRNQRLINFLPCSTQMSLIFIPLIDTNKYIISRLNFMLSYADQKKKVSIFGILIFIGKFMSSWKEHGKSCKTSWLDIKQRKSYPTMFRDTQPKRDLPLQSIWNTNHSCFCYVGTFNNGLWEWTDIIIIIIFPYFFFLSCFGFYDPSKFISFLLSWAKE